MLGCVGSNRFTIRLGFAASPLENPYPDLYNPFKPQYHNEPPE